MYSKWDALRQDTEGEVQLIKGEWDEEAGCWILGLKDTVEDNYIPKPRPPKKGGSNHARGEDMP